MWNSALVAIAVSLVAASASSAEAGMCEYRPSQLIGGTATGAIGVAGTGAAVAGVGLKLAGV
jgi:hypothetical protein